jgi:Peptidase family S41
MKNLLIIVLCLIANITFTQTILKAEDLQKDFAIARKSYEQMHPGLYKYQTKEAIDRAFEECKTALNHDQPLAEAYLNFHKLTSKFKCGHTYPNFYNQEEFLKKELFEQKVCLPFQFQLIEDRMLITHSADSTLSDKIEVKTINGFAVSNVIKTLLPIVRADGSNDAKRRKLLEIGGQTFEYFDIFFPMYFPLKTDSFELEIYDFNSKKTSKISVKALDRVKRNEILKAKYPESQLVNAKFNWFDNKTAIMQINNLAVYNKAFDFDKFYLNSVNEYNQKQGKNLIIDIRKCEGGNTSEMIKLVRYLTKNNIEIKNEQDCWAYVKIDSTLKQYVDNKSWAFGWFNMNEKYFTKLENGQYRSKDGDKSEVIIPEKINLEGTIYLLTSATNSSAGYIMADIFKKYHLATLVGQTTGGNQRGITAGAMFFMSLPNTKIEVDVPLIGMNYDLAKTRPDAGLSPDVYVKPNILDAVRGIDTEMEMVKKLIAKNGKK